MVFFFFPWQEDFRGWGWSLENWVIPNWSPLTQLQPLGDIKYGKGAMGMGKELRFGGFGGGNSDLVALGAKV